MTCSIKWSLDTCSWVTWRRNWYGRGRIGNTSGGWDARYIGRSVDSLGSVLQHHSIHAMIIATQVTSQTETLAIIIFAARFLSNDSWSVSCW